MIRPKRILKDYAESGALNALLNIHGAIGPHAFVTKSGALLVMLGVQGIDDECLDIAELEQITQRFRTALSVLNEDFRIYQYILKHDQRDIPCREYANPAVQTIVQDRIRYLAECPTTLQSINIYWVVVYEGWRPSQSFKHQFEGWLKQPKAGIREPLSTDQTIESLKRQLEQAEEFLMNRVNAFAIQLRDCVAVQVLDIDTAYRFLVRLLNYAPYKAATIGLKYDQFVDYQACGSLLECERDHLRLDNYFVQVLTLKESPAQTFAHLFRGLEEIPANFILATEWKRVNSSAIRRLILSKRRHFRATELGLAAHATSSSTAPGEQLRDEGAAANVSELGDCLAELEIKGNYFGEFSLTVVLYDDDRSKVRRCVAEVSKVFATQGAQLTEETYNLLNAWLAVIPGNNIYNVRRLYLLNTNYADLAFLFCPSKGELENNHLAREYLAVLETNQHTPFFLNLQYLDVSHTFALGMTGSGKTFLMNFVIAHAQKYEPITFIFDLGGSYRALTRRFGGVYVPIGLGTRSFSINPFCLPKTKENLHFQFSLVKLFIESAGTPVTGSDQDDLYEQIENLYELEPNQRRLGTLAQILNRRLAQPLTKWVGEGQYGSIFDNVDDNFTLSRFQTFDFEGMNKYPQILEPLLFYVLYRASTAVNDPQEAMTFKLFLMDEAWRFLLHPTTRAYILEGLKTWRKRRAAMILATQSSEDLLRSEMLGTLLESCPTQLFLANPGMDLNAYREVFHLNETQAELISRLIPKKQFLLKRPDMAKVLNLNVERASYCLYSNDLAATRNNA